MSATEDDLDFYLRAYENTLEENVKMKDVILTIKRQCELLMPKNGLNPVTQRGQLCQTFINLIKRELGDLIDE